VARQEPQASELERDDGWDGAAKDVRRVQHEAVAPQADDKVDKAVEVLGTFLVPRVDVVTLARARTTADNDG